MRMLYRQGQKKGNDKRTRGKKQKSEVNQRKFRAERGFDDIGCGRGRECGNKLNDLTTGSVCVCVGGGGGEAEV